MPLIPLLECFGVVNFELPGHGLSTSNNYAWRHISSLMQSELPNQNPTLYVLHSFSCALLPEIVEVMRPMDRVILLEGIIHIDDAKWSSALIESDVKSENKWIQNFRRGRIPALRRQLSSLHDKRSLDIWSQGFLEVRSSAIKVLARQLLSRLKGDEIEKSLHGIQGSVVFVRGENTSLSQSCFDLLHRFQVPTFEVQNSGHFPMIDNPLNLFSIIQRVGPSTFLSS